MLRVIHHKENTFGEGTMIRYGFPKDHDLKNLDEPLIDVLRRWKKYVRSDESWMK